MKIKSIVGCAILIFFSVWHHKASANLITNSGFEDFSLQLNSWDVFSSIPGWSSSQGAGIEVQNHVAGNPHSGQQHVELASHNPSNMFQEIITTAGQLYDLNLFYSPRPGKRSGNNGIEIWWGGSLVDTLFSIGDSQGTVWSEFNYLLLATTNNTILEFRDVSNGFVSYGGYLDDISLLRNLTPNAIPTPNVFWSLILALAFFKLARSVNLIKAIKLVRKF